MKIVLSQQYFLSILFAGIFNAGLTSQK